MFPDSHICATLDLGCNTLFCIRLVSASEFKPIHVDSLIPHASPTLTVPSIVSTCLLTTLHILSQCSIYYLTLIIPRTNSVKAGDQLFSNVGPTLWMTLPKDIRDFQSFPPFKKLLKTHLSKLVYDYYTQLLYNAINEHIY